MSKISEFEKKNVENLENLGNLRNLENVRNLENLRNLENVENTSKCRKSPKRLKISENVWNPERRLQKRFPMEKQTDLSNISDAHSIDVTSRRHIF